MSENSTLRGHSDVIPTDFPPLPCESEVESLVMFWDRRVSTLRSLGEPERKRGDTTMAEEVGRLRREVGEYVEKRRS